MAAVDDATAAGLAGLNRLWVPDDFSDECMDCKVPFRLSKWRYHCRVCGLLFCYECNKTKMEIPTSFGYTGTQSCCRSCVVALQQKTITSPADVFAHRRVKNLHGGESTDASSVEPTLAGDAVGHTEEVSSSTLNHDHDSKPHAGSNIGAPNARNDQARCHACLRPFDLGRPVEMATAVDETVVTVVSIAANTAVDCVKCGRKVAASDRFCVYCGTKAGASLVQLKTQVKHTGLAALDKLWVPDDFSDECMACNAPFSFSKWRHHCRVCGLLFCHKCAKTKMELPASFGYAGAQSCCGGCVVALQQKTIKSPADVFTQRRRSDSTALAGKAIG